MHGAGKRFPTISLADAAPAAKHRPMSRAHRVVLPLLLVCACSDPVVPAVDAGRDASAPADAAAPRDAAADAAAPTDTGVALADASEPDSGVPADGGVSPVDASEPDGGPPADAGMACTRPVGVRYSAGDACNFCECQADGTELCTQRVCQESIGGCEYGGVAHDYGARFPSADGCNVCVCAASGLACTTRAACTDVPDSAILIESSDTPCGRDPMFTPARVLATLPVSDFEAPFLYERTRPLNLYPETLPDTDVRVRIVYDGGFQVCRLPSLDQPALDIQVTVEWMTADGALHEGFQAYLRRNNFGFLDAWLVHASQPLGGLNGSYMPNCAIDPGDYSFQVQVEPDGHATGSMHRVCETDISLTVGTFDRPAP